MGFPEKNRIDVYDRSGRAYWHASLGRKYAVSGTVYFQFMVELADLLDEVIMTLNSVVT